MAKQVGGVAAKVEALVRPVIEELGLRLWEVRFDKDGADWFLRVLIDRDEPLDTDTCELATRAIDPLLDEADPVDHGYILEVGSPGLGRRLSRDAHFEALTGQKVRLKFYHPNADGQKELAGILRGKTADILQLEGENGLAEHPVKDIAGVWLCDDEDLFNIKKR